MRGWGLPWLFAGLAGAGIGPGAEPPVRIQADAPYTRTLAAGEIHRYRLTLDSGDYARLEVVQQGLDVATVVRGPSGTEVEVDFPTGRFSTESVSLIAEEDGEYEIEVRASHTGDAGRYELTLAALHGAGPDDRLRVEAEGADLLAAGSLEAARRALASWQSLGDRAGEGRALTRLAKVLEASGQREEALAIYEEAIALHRDLDDREGLAEALDHLGRMLARLGEQQRALDALQESADLLQEIDQPDRAALVSVALGNQQHSFGDSGAALAACERGLVLSRKAADPAQESQALNCLGKVRSQIGRPLQALEDFRKALELSRPTGRLSYEAQTLSNLGMLYQDLGVPHEALEHFAKAREMFHALSEREGEAIALNNLGNLLFRLGALEEARELLEKSLPLLHDPRTEANVLVSLSRIAEELGDLAKASSLTARALELQRGARYPAGEAESLRAQGLLLLESGEAAAAEKRLRESLSLYEELGRRSRAAAARLGLARALAAQGKLDAARQAYDASRQEAEALGDVGAQAAALAELGRLEHLDGKLLAARKQLEAALGLLESFRSEVGGDGLRARHFAMVRETYERYVDVLMQLHRADPGAGLDARAFELAEQSRARGLLDVLARARVDTRKGDRGLLDRELRLRQELNAKAALRLTLADDESSRARRAALAREIEALTTEHRIVEARLEKGSSYESRKKHLITVSEIQALLDPQTVLLEYLLAEPRSYLWVVGPASLKAYELPGRQEIAQRARSLHEHLKDPAERDAAGQRSDLRLLAQAVLGPVLGEIAGKRLIVVPDGALHYVPFAALQVPSEAGTVFLVEKHEIGFLPSAAVLKEIRQAGAARPRRPTSIAVVADPAYDGTETEPRRVLKEVSRGQGPAALPWTRQEAEDIAAVAKGRRELLVFTGHEATRELVTSGRLEPYRALHFATHGILDSGHPEQSGLVLSQRDSKGNPIDGFLSLQDLYALRLQADLVVLSGCDTGLGRELRGEGLVGLTHGFLHAGASQVVASLWPVRDRASAELMQRFYGSMLRDGLRPAAALRAAQLDMLTNQRTWRDPYYWAAFVAQGDWTSGL